MTEIYKYITKHLEGIENSFKNTNLENLEKIISFFEDGVGNVFLTGVGKNGHVAAKAVSTLNSMGVKSFYINPVDSVHGDIGIIDKNDKIIAISKSGNTDELLNFLHHANRRTNHIFLIHSNKNNNSLRYCEFDLYIPIDFESDHLNKVPTVSIAVYTILLQSISCLLAKKQNLTMESFVFNHPGGTIGKTKII
jgi:arabinose-5-phosphate isomerase